MAKKPKVFIGVGHGGKDAGAIGNGFEEEDLNLAIALACNEELKRHGVDVLLSRYVDEDDGTNEEVAECNAFAPDLAADIHNNAGGGDGVEIFHHYGGGKGKTLAQNILNEIVAIGQNSRGLKTRKNSNGKDYYGFIRSTKAPAIIVECAFIDNANDIKIIDTAAEQKKMGVAIAKGILKTLGITYKKEETKVANKTKFNDESKMSSWAVEPIKRATELKIMSGVGNSKFNPKGNLTREEAAVMAMNLYDAVAKLLDK